MTFNAIKWSLLSVDDDMAQELLEEICSMWLSIRSQALTRRWMENYKKKSTKKAKGLRKELKNKDNNKEAMGKGKNEEIGEGRKEGEDRKEKERGFIY